MVEPVRVLDDRTQFFKGIVPKNLLRGTASLFTEIQEGAEKRAGAELLWARDTKKCLQVRTDRPRDLSDVTRSIRDVIA